MDYTIFNERFAGISEGTCSVVAELVATASENIPYYSDIEGKLLVPGSVAIVPSESAIYILDADLLWTNWDTGNKLPAPATEDNDPEEEDQNA